jgi:hypothetical protein
MNGTGCEEGGLSSGEPCPRPNRTPHPLRPGTMVRVLLLTLLAIAGCASTTPPLAAPPPPDPTSLIGWWRVAETGQTVLIDPAAIEILDDKGSRSGTWRADPDGHLVARIDTLTVPASGRVQPTPPDALPSPQPVELTPPWIAATAAFRIEGTDRLLLDRAGAPTAHLIPDPAAKGSGVIDPGRPATPEEQHAMAPAAPVAPPLRPATPAELAGQWRPAGSDGPARVAFAADGAWDGSDGCNANSGRWVAGPGGGFLAVSSSVQTLIACPGQDDAGGRLPAARRAAFDGDELVLLDVDGGTVGRFARG